MLNENEIRQIPLAAFFAAAGIILPQLFHLIGLGPMFLPMFLPVMLGSLLLTWRFALALAIICPSVSWLLTSMPPLVPPVLPVMLVELAVLSLVLSILHIHLNKPVWLALIIAIISDRLLLFFLIYIIAPLFGISHPLFSFSLVISGAPGIILQLITIPLALKFIEQKFPNYREIRGVK